MLDQEKATAQVSKRDRLIFTTFWGFLEGVFVASIFSIPPIVSLLLVAIAFVSYIFERHIFILWALCSIAFGILCFGIKDFHELKPAGDIGVVISETDYRESDARFVVKTNTGEKVLVSTNLLTSVNYGDEVRLSGEARRLEPDGYADYLSKDDIFYTMNRAEVEILSSGNGSFVKTLLLNLKQALVSEMREILPEPESSLLAGLVVSGKQALPQETLEEFRRSGVVHIVVLSGYNITIVAEFLFALFRRLGVRAAASTALAGVSLFTVMAGAPATVLRGAVMVSLLMLGKVFGREGNAPRILLFTGALMVLMNPKILLHDPSFHLSFLAMLGLIYGVPIIDKLFSRIPDRWGLRTLVSSTLATQIFVFPYILYNMGNFSTVFLLTNLAVLSVIPITMLVGFVSTTIAFFSNILAWPTAFLSHLLLSWILGVASILGSLPFASLEIENFPLWGVGCLYVLLAFSLWRLRNFAQLPTSLDS